jgi:DNA polymerase III epsilon subunit-like protein
MIPPQTTEFKEELPLREIVRMTLQNWFNAYGDLTGSFPESYIVFDCETTGTIFGEKAKYKGCHDLITQIGHCIVKDRVPVLWDGVILDWTNPEMTKLHEHPETMDQVWLSSSLTRLEHIMADKGRTYQVPYERMQREGGNPIEMLEAYHKIFADARAEAFFFVGHNAINFDSKMLSYHFKQYLDKELKWGANEIFDTGMMEKATQLDPTILPWPGDTIRDWAERVNRVRAYGVYWSLDGHCASKYDLAAKHDIDMSKAHDAGFDCYMTHLLFETYRELAEEVPVVDG